MTARTEWPCPLCDQHHDGCEWRAGSLLCVNDPCGNPHCQARARRTVTARGGRS